jgi:hypothetical protein
MIKRLLMHLRQTRGHRLDRFTFAVQHQPAKVTFTPLAPADPRKRREHIRREVKQPSTKLLHLENVHVGLTRDRPKSDKALLDGAQGVGG